MKEEVKKIIQYKHNFLNYHKNTSNPEIQEMIEYIKKVDRFGMLNSPLEQKYTNYNVECYYDMQCEMPYLYEGNKKLYFPHGYDEKRVKNLYSCLKREQDLQSPHRYIDEEDLKIIKEQRALGRKCICLDVGAMEGMFSLSLVEEVDELHLFECESEWSDALKQTFEQLGGRVVNKFVGEHTFDEYINIDDYLKDSDLHNVFLIVKMDIEGYERFALKGMKKTLDSVADYLLFVCAYHRQDDEEVIRDMFKKHKIRNTKGYFCFYVAEDYDVPYVRRCVLKVQKN